MSLANVPVHARHAPGYVSYWWHITQQAWSILHQDRLASRIKYTPGMPLANMPPGSCHYRLHIRHAPGQHILIAPVQTRHACRWYGLNALWSRRWHHIWATLQACPWLTPSMACLWLHLSITHPCKYMPPVHHTSVTYQAYPTRHAPKT